jgi:hypothetical protein
VFLWFLGWLFVVFVGVFVVFLIVFCQGGRGKWSSVLMLRCFRYFLVDVFKKALKEGRRK